MAVAALGSSGRGLASLWLIWLLLAANSNGQAQAAPAKTATVAGTPTAAQHLQQGVKSDTPTLLITARQQYVSASMTTTTATTAAPPTAATATAATKATATAAVVITNSSSELPATTNNHLQSVVQLLDLELTAAPPINKGHDGLKLTKKKQLQQQHFHTTTAATTTIETEVERMPTTTTTTTTTSRTTSRTTTESGQPTVLAPVPNGYLGPIFMGEKIISVVHPLKKPQPANAQQHHQQPKESIETQLREGRIVEILAPTALLESNVESSSSSTTTTNQMTSTTTNRPAVPQTHTMLSTTVFQVPEQQTSTTRLPMAAAEISVAAPPRTESKISDIQIEVYDSTVDSIVASTNFRDNQGYYPLPLEPALGTTRPPSSPPVAQERFTQYVIDRADVSTQPAEPGVGKPEPAAIEIHINVSEAFGNESEDLEFSYRQPPSGESKPSKGNDEILVVEIIDSSAADNSTENVSSSVSSEHMNLNPMFNYPYRSDAPAAQPPAVRPPQTQDADELFMADRGVALPRPPHPPPPPPMPRKPASIDRDSDTIFYISNTEVKVGESLPTASSGANEQQRKLQLENQFFPASYGMEQQRSSSATPRYEEDIILSPLHNTADALKILRSPSAGGDGAPPLDVTYVGESVIEVEQQSLPLSASSTLSPPISVSSTQPDIIIQPAILPDLAIGVPVIGELPPQIELKEIDYMPGELLGQSQGIYENDIESNSLGMGNDPDVIESSIQYGGDLIDDGAGGGFDGVEGSYPFDSLAHRMQQQDAVRQPLGHRFSHLHREQQPAAELLNATLQQRNESASDLGGASAMAPLQHGGNQLLEEKSSNLQFSSKSENLLADYFNFIAISVGLIIVILAAGLLTSMFCGVRYFLNKNATSSAAGDDSEQGQGQDSKHEDISRNARETKMHTDKDGVFVVEVARGIDSKQPPDSPAAGVDTTELPFDTNTKQAAALEDRSLPPSHEQVQIHAPPSDFANPMPATVGGTTAAVGGLHLIEEEQLADEEMLPEQQQPLQSAATGLSQSDLSSTSSTDSNKRYSYGNQELYVIDQTGYVTNAPTVLSIPLIVSEELTEMEQEIPQLKAGPEEKQKQLEVQSEMQVRQQKEQQLEQQSEKNGEKKQTELKSEQQTEKQLEQQSEKQLEHQSEMEVAQQKQQQMNQHSDKQSENQTELESEKQSEEPLEQQSETAETPGKEMPVPAPAAFGNVEEKLPVATPIMAEKATELNIEAEEKTNEETKEEAQEETNEMTQLKPKAEADATNKTAAETEKAVEDKPQEEYQEEFPVQTERQQEDLKPEEARQEELQLNMESENNYDSLMSLPAPPSNEEIKELNDFTLMESNQLDSLPPPPPPPPPPPTNDNGPNHNDNDKPMELESMSQLKEPKETKAEYILSNGNGKQPVAAPPTANGVSGVGGVGSAEEPSTLTPPASPPASPTAAASLCGGSLSNGIHAVAVPMAVDVNGS